VNEEVAKTSALGPDTLRGALPSVGAYDLLEKIAEGGMGAIYRGRHRASGQVVAIKVLPPHLAANPVLLKRFEQEFRAASRLDHPNIVRALDYGDAGNSPYLVMEYVEGESLGQKLDRDGKMPEADAIRIIAQVAQGLHRAHKHNLVHRDVKPDNILVRSDGVAKLADLGLVKETDTDLNLTRTGRGLGTPHFMAPEQFRNAKGADIRCDIYSLGATLYQMVTGKLPFESNGPLDAWMKKMHNELVSPKDVVPGLSDRVNWAILRAMSARAELRPRSCREFVEDLTGHSTRRLPGTQSSTSSGQDLWYLIYKDEAGATHTVKGSTAAIRRSLKEGLLGDAGNVRASRAKTGPFELLRAHPEFRDLLVWAAPLPLSAAAAAEATRPLPVPHDAPSPSTTELPVPHIALAPAKPPASGGSFGWLGWAFLLVLAGASAAAAFWLLPERWWRFW
jgi:serine/threonine protein kinase